jgi:hypothetical protein
VVRAKDVDGLAAKLRSGAVPPIADTEYDRLYVVTLIGASQANVLTLHYAGCAP